MCDITLRAPTLARKMAGKCWLPGDADRQEVGWMYGHVITKIFFGGVDHHIFLGMGLSSRMQNMSMELRYYKC